MKLRIFGSTGSIGRLLIKQALEQGHTVTAFTHMTQLNDALIEFYERLRTSYCERRPFDVQSDVPL